MANRKNNLSDNTLNKAAGGRMVEENGNKVVYDNNSLEKLAEFEGTDFSALRAANAYDTGYHKGKEKGLNKGRQIGFKQGYDAAKSVVDNNGQL